MIQLAKPLADILETEWDGMLFRSKDCLAKSTGWTSYHTLRSKGSRSGYPDRTLFRDRIILAELKREKAKPTDEQVFWLNGLARAGGEVYLWRPSDLDEISVILARRWGFVSKLVGGPSYLQHHEYGWWTPKSLWVAGSGRADDAGVAGGTTRVG